MKKAPRIVFDRISTEDMKSFGVKNKKELETIVDDLVFEQSSELISESISETRLFLIDSLLDGKKNIEKIKKEYVKEYKKKITTPTLLKHINKLRKRNIIKYQQGLYSIPKRKEALADVLLWVADTVLEQTIEIEKRMKSLREKFTKDSKLEKIFHKFIDQYHIGNIKKANYYINQALKKSPNEPFFLHAKAKCLNETGQFKRAIKYLNHAIKLNPKEHVFWFDRANAYAGTGDFKRAVKNFEKTLKLEPNSVEALCFMGASYSMMNDMKSSMKCVAKAMLIDPEKTASIVQHVFDSDKLDHEEFDEVFYAG